MLPKSNNPDIFSMTGILCCLRRKGNTFFPEEIPGMRIVKIAGKQRKVVRVKDVDISPEVLIRKQLQSFYPDLFMIWNGNAWGKKMIITVLKALSRQNIWIIRNLFDLAKKL